ncbi:MAG: 2-oxoglutarate dehydrogenase E1 component [Gammaproteobacteria bacterium]
MPMSSFQSQLSNSYLSGSNADYLEDLYEEYLRNPQAIAPEWRDYFQSLGAKQTDVSHQAIREQFAQKVQHPQVAIVQTGDVAQAQKQAAVARLIEAYRTYGHLIAKINPLEEPHPTPAQLNISYYPELSPADYQQPFLAPGLMAGPASLQAILDRLTQIYASSIGTEFKYISDLTEVQWIQDQLESHPTVFSETEKLDILKQLTETEGLEKYLANKYVGQKRFSLEGGDAFIPFVHAVNLQSAKQGVQEILVGMAHRGRLNILVNVFGKPAEELFKEFEGRKDFGLTSGDVKYHLGTASDIETPFGPLHLMLAFNPSHLEIISAVLMGSVRARQHRRHQEGEKTVLGLVVHGDASFSGQGVVMETLNMSQTNAYKIGGVVHVIINNQVGFTTSEPTDSRSSLYCSDPAKMIDAPIFHVNGDDPEAVVKVAQLAVDYRTKFRKDVVVDLVCYRRLGHNEADEPIATQPLMYHFIRQHPTTRELYAQKLVAEQVCTEQQAQNFVTAYRDLLDTGAAVVKTLPNYLAHQYAANWQPYLHQNWHTSVTTAVPIDKLYALAKKLEQLPAGFEVQRQVQNTLESRGEMTEGKLPLNWGYAETLAFATLLDQGYSIRMSGEDCRRGTFAHRHAALHDQKTGKTYVPLAQLANQKATLEIYDSLLSEVGTMGFEYGYASTDPEALVLWEAQYGDFANGAQVVVDQFMSSAWQKWCTLAGLVLLLPHGYEGDGPEHTSARLERYLQLCAEKNMQVCIPTTPAQIFHLLRRQVIRPYRTPLIVLTPKSLLRHKLAVSTLEDLAKGEFELVIPEIDAINTAKVNRLIICTGKVYYDLLAKRRELNCETIAIIRLEQLYPYPYEALQAQLKLYAQVQDIVWCQEEPENQGSWYTLRNRFERILLPNQQIRCICRPAAASPAVGYKKLHVKQQADLIQRALET